MYLEIFFQDISVKLTTTVFNRKSNLILLIKSIYFKKNALVWEEKCLAWQIPQDVESAAATAAPSSMPINLSPLDDFLEIKEEEEKETVKKQQKTENKIKKRKEKKRKLEEALNENTKKLQKIKNK